MPATQPTTPADRPPDPTSKEAQRELNCAPATFFKLLNEGEIDGYYVGRHIRVTRESLDRYKQRRAYRKPGTKPVGFRGSHSAAG